MSSHYIPHGQSCDFGLMVWSGGEWYAHNSDFEYMEQIAKDNKTQVVQVTDCEGAPFCIAPLPIARWIIRVMSKEYGRMEQTPFDQINEEFSKDWEGSGKPDERRLYKGLLNGD